MTTNAMTFGLTLPQRGVFFGVTTVDEMLDLASRAEQSGLFDSTWVGDSLFSKPRPESLTLLGALAARTEKLKLGVGCMATFPVRDPIVFAYEWATLDLISNGRMLLAACTGIVRGGASAHEGKPYGVTDKERAARLEENIEICRRLWAEEDVSFSGNYRSFESLTLEPRPVQQPCPIWIAANPSDPKFVERSLRRVARMADGWMSVQLFPKMFAMNWQRLAEYLPQEGKDAASFPTMAYGNININPDRQAALEESKRFLDEYYGPVFSPEMVGAWTVAGSPQECIAQLRALRADGAKSVTLRATAWDQAGQYERMVNEVLPYVHEA